MEYGGGGVWVVKVLMGRSKIFDLSSGVMEAVRMAMWVVCAILTYEVGAEEGPQASCGRLGGCVSALPFGNAKGGLCVLI